MIVKLFIGFKLTTHLLQTLPLFFDSNLKTASYKNNSYLGTYLQSPASFSQIEEIESYVSEAFYSKFPNKKLPVLIVFPELLIG